MTALDKRFKKLLACKTPVSYFRRCQSIKVLKSLGRMLMLHRREVLNDREIFTALLARVEHLDPSLTTYMYYNPIEDRLTVKVERCSTLYDLHDETLIAA